jgi:hypothetical protein
MTLQKPKIQKNAKSWESSQALVAKESKQVKKKQMNESLKFSSSTHIYRQSLQLLPLQSNGRTISIWNVGSIQRSF